MPNLYPVFLSLCKRACLVAGLGNVGCRKLRGLLSCSPARVLALDIRPETALAPGVRKLLENPRVDYQNRGFEPEDARKSFLVYAATSDPRENRRILAICQKENILCDSATDPADNDFFTPAVARAGALAAAMSTAGQSPYLAGKWRLELEKWLIPRARLAWLLGRLRPLVIACGLSQAENREAFKKIADSPLVEWLERNELAKCRVWLENEFPLIEPRALGAVLAEFENDFS